MIESTANQSSQRSQIRVAKIAAVSAILVPAGFATLIDWNTLPIGATYFAAAQIGTLAVVLGLFAMVMLVMTAIAAGKSFLGHLAIAFAGVGLIVFIGMRWLAGFDGAFGQPVLNLVQLLTLGMMFAVIGYLFEVVTTMRTQSEQLDSAPTSRTAMEESAS